MMEPTLFVKTFAKTLPPSSAIDIGCGNGRNSYFLSNKGWDVTAVDIRNQNLEKINFTVSSLLDLPTNKSYSLVLCLMVLHFLPSKATVNENIEKLKQLTAPEGYLLLSVITNQNKPGTRPYLFDDKELISHFSDWTIIKNENTLANPIIDNAQEVKYWVNRVIVQK